MDACVAVIVGVSIDIIVFVVVFVVDAAYIGVVFTGVLVVSNLRRYVL